MQSQEAFIHQAIDGGRFEIKEDAVREALTLWEHENASGRNSWLHSTMPKPLLHAVKGGSSRSKPCGSLQRK